MYVSEVRLKFTPNFKLLMFGIVFLPILFALGVWQLDRAEEKRTLQEQFLVRSQAPAADYTALSKQFSTTLKGANLDYFHVRMVGHFIDGAQWLFENQILHGRPGYHVLNLFQLTAGDVVLVDRGWLEAKAYRDQLPQTAFPKGELTLTGIVKTPGKNRMLSYQPEIISGQKVVAALNLEKMGAEFELRLKPYVMYLDQANPATYVENWPVIATRPQKHNGYAIQWFCMAFALCVLTLHANSNFTAWLNNKRKGKTS